MLPASPQAPSSHLARIDVLRGVAILIVFSSHFSSVVYGNPTNCWIDNWYCWSDSPSWFEQGLRLTIFNGDLGVGLFFVVSGLCIRLSQLREESFSLTHFYWRRFWRIYPPYLLALVVFVIWQQYGNLRDILAHVFLIHNLFVDTFTSINGPFWSLALEAQVYLLYPCLLGLHHRLGAFRTATLLAFLAAVSAIGGGETFRHYFNLPNAFEAIRHLPTSLWFTWYMGVLLADALVASAAPGWLSRLILVTALACYPAIKLCRPLQTFQFPVIGLILALLTFEYLKGPSLFPTGRRGWACLGICSYSFYLYFDQLIFPCLHFLTGWWHPSSPWVLFAIGYPLTLLAIFAFSYLAYQMIELKSIAFGRAWYLRLTKKISAGKAG